MMIWSHPECMASSTPYWMMGLSTTGSISLGWALVAGKKRVPRPAAGNTAFLTFIFIAVLRFDDCEKELYAVEWPSQEARKVPLQRGHSHETHNVGLSLPSISRRMILTGGKPFF